MTQLVNEMSAGSMIISLEQKLFAITGRHYFYYCAEGEFARLRLFADDVHWLDAMQWVEHKVQTILPTLTPYQMRLPIEETKQAEA